MTNGVHCVGWVKDTETQNSVRQPRRVVCVIGKSRLAQPASLRDEREGLNLKSPSKVHKAFLHSLQLLSLPILRVLTNPHLQGRRATRKKTSIGIHTDIEFALSLNPTFLFLSSRTAHGVRFT